MLTLGDAFASAVDSWVAADPALRDKFPLTRRYIFEVAVMRFEKRAASLGLSPVMAENAVAEGFARLERLNRVAESPIERALAPWLLFEHYGDRFGTVPAQVHIPGEDAAVPPCDLFIVPQFPFARRRLDFAVVGVANGVRHMVAVECDGAEFHDAEKDRQRDAYFASWGIPTVRATGAQIYTEPFAVSGRIVSELQSLTEDRRQ